MPKKLQYFLFLAVAVLTFVVSGFGQQTDASETVKPVQVTKNETPKKRRTGIKIEELKKVPAEQDFLKEVESDGDNLGKELINPEKMADSPTRPDADEIERRRKEEEEKAEKIRVDRIKAGEAALERETQKAAEEAAREAARKYAVREAELKAQLDAMTKAAELELAETLRKAEAEKKENAEKEEMRKRETQQQIKAQENELNKIRQQAEAELKAKLDAEAQAAEARKKAETAEAERVRIGAKAALEQKRLRGELIQSVAAKLKYLQPADAVPLVADDITEYEEIKAVLEEASQTNPRLVRNLSYCDTGFAGDDLTLDYPSPVTLGSFLYTLRDLYAVDFMPDIEILDLPVKVNVLQKPWDGVLQKILAQNDLKAECSDGTVSILKRAKYLALQDSEKKSSDVLTKIIRFKHLKPGLDGANGDSSGGFEALESQIASILAADPRSSVVRIAGGKSGLIVRATEEQLQSITTNIEVADVPLNRVMIYATVYTANKSRLKDFGGNVSIVGGTGNLSALGGLTNFPTASGDGGNQGGAGGVVPGGVRSLGSGFSFPQGGGISGGVTGIIGTNQFSAQLNLLVQNGVSEIWNNPNVVTNENLTAKIDLGRQIPIAIPVFSGGGVGNGSIQILNAGNTLAITPQVFEDVVTGRPKKVRLSVQLESNEPDTSISTQGIPTIQKRSSQNIIDVGLDETVIIGGFTTLSKTFSVNEAPVLGKIPILGYLFKRKVDQKQEVFVYFAIRAVVVQDGETLNNFPLEIDTQPKAPTDKFFNPADARKSYDSKEKGTKKDNKDN